MDRWRRRKITIRETRLSAVKYQKALAFALSNK
jgi:hypothetical protein